MNSRRSFLQKIGISTAGLAIIPFAGVDAAILDNQNSITRFGKLPFNVIQIEGRVISKGRGIPEVNVSDGNQVVQTDASGRFRFLSHTQRDFVFISIPSGYKIKQQANGSAQFFYRLDKQKNKNSFLFYLDPLDDSDVKHHFLVLADPQIQNEYEANLLLETTTPDVIRTIQDLGSENVFGIGCGDLIFDHHELFSSYNQAVKNMDIPFFQVIGNHDVDLDMRTDEKTTKTFNAHYGPAYYSYNRGEIHYVVLDDVFFIGSDKKYIGYITEEQLSWLEQDLQFITPGSTVVVSLHIPSVTGHARRYPKETSLGGTVSNREHLYAILEPFRAHLLSGHTHFNDNMVLSDRLYEHCHGTVCGAWWSGPICFDGTPNGYGVYTANGSSLSWYYKGTELEKEQQFRIYKKGEHPDHIDMWSINVWNWDPQWHVCWYEDGIKKGELVRIVARDPLSIKLHEGPKIPTRRKWVEPQLTDHMFFFNPSEDAKTIVVEVIDRFGSVFSEVVQLG